MSGFSSKKILLNKQCLIPDTHIIFWVNCHLVNYFKHAERYLWSIQTELKWDRDRELELNRYYACAFTLQQERDQDRELKRLFTCPKLRSK